MKYWIIGFFILQMAIDLAHSVTVFPFVHYAMFSASFAPQDSVQVYNVIVDGQPLHPSRFSIYQWDMVQTPLEAAEKRAATNDFAFDKEKLQSGLRALGLGSLYNQLKPNLDNTGSFASWYKGYLSRLLRRPIGALRVDNTCSRWNAGRLVLLQPQNPINQ